MKTSTKGNFSSRLDEIFQAIKLVRQSARADRRTYVRKDRPISLARFVSSVKLGVKEPIFLIGAPRSGTTFLGDCLSVLPDVSYHFEPVGTKFAARYLYEGTWNFEKGKRFYSITYSWLSKQYLDSDLRFAEKTPRNCFLIDFLAQAFPDSQFIHIIRDGRDAALSYSKKPWLQASQAVSGQSEPGGYPYGPYARFWVEPHLVEKFETTSDIHRCIWAWRRFTESALGASCQLAEGRYYELRYENLVNNSIEEADQLLSFLSITHDQSKNLFRQAVSQARPDSIGQWKRELTSEQLLQIENEAGSLLRQLGYLS